MNLEEIIKILKLYKDNPSIMDDDNYIETIVNTFESLVKIEDDEKFVEKIFEEIGKDICNQFCSDIVKKVDYIYNNKKELFNEIGISSFFPELTGEILEKYGEFIIYYCENESRISWIEPNLIEFLIKQGRYDLLKKVVQLEEVFRELRPETRKKLLENLDREKIDEIILQSRDLLAIFPHFTREILDNYGQSIIKNIETHYFECIDENLIDYLFEQKRIDLISVKVPNLTEEMLKKYSSLIISYIENNDIRWFYNNKTGELLFEYLAENNRFDLIFKINLVPNIITPEILNKYGLLMIKYLENNVHSSSGEENLLEKLIFGMDINEIFSSLTPETLKKYGQEIIKQIEFNKWYGLECTDEHLIEYLFEQKRIDLIRKRVPNLNEKILKKYGSLIIDYIESNEIENWPDESLFKYLVKNNLGLITKMGMENVIPKLTKEILNEYDQVIIEYLENKIVSPWNDKCLLNYLVDQNRLDLILKMSLDASGIETMLPVVEKIYNISHDDLKHKIDYLYNRNDEILSTLNFKILKLNIPEDVLLTITLYPNIQEKIIDLDNVVSSKFFEIIEKVKSKKYDTVQVIESILNNVSNYKNLLNNLDINSLNENELNNLIYVLQNKNNIFNILNIEDLKEENFKIKKEIYFRNIDNNLNNLALNDLKEAIVESIYGISLEKAKFISDRYSYDFDVLRKDGLDEKIITIIENLNKIVNETDISKLKVIYQTRNDIPSLETDFMSSLSLEASIRKEYARMYNNTLYQVSRDDLSKNSKLNNVTYNGKKIEIYEPGDEFHMQIHALGAYRGFSRPDNFKDDWLRPKLAYHGICTSYIANNEIATARQRHPILGFSNYEENALLLAGNYDLNSDTSILSYATSSSYPYDFLPPKTMIDATRHNHNEMVIERVKQDSNNMKKRTPNYIVYIIDDINNGNNFDINNPLYQENLQAAYDFDVPIVIVDRLKYAKQEKEKCDSLEREFNDSRNPETLRELFLNYMNNWVGCRKFVENPEAEYNNIFNDEVVCEFYKRITNLIKNDIHEMKDINKTNEEILMMIKLLQHEINSRYIPEPFEPPSPFDMREAINEYRELLKEFKAKLTALKQNEVIQDVVLEETVSKTM